MTLVSHGERSESTVLKKVPTNRCGVSQAPLNSVSVTVPVNATTSPVCIHKLLKSSTPSVNTTIEPSQSVTCISAPADAITVVLEQVDIGCISPVIVKGTF